MDNNLRAFLQKLIDAGLVDESEALEARRVLEAPGPVLLPAQRSCAARLPRQGRGRGARPRLDAPRLSVASFLLGSLLVADASVGDEERKSWVTSRSSTSRSPSRRPSSPPRVSAPSVHHALRRPLAWTRPRPATPPPPRVAESTKCREWRSVITSTVSACTPPALFLYYSVIL